MAPASRSAAAKPLVTEASVEDMTRDPLRSTMLAMFLIELQMVGVQVVDKQAFLKLPVRQLEMRGGRPKCIGPSVGFKAMA